MAANSRFAVAVHATAALAHGVGIDGEWMSSERLADSLQTNPVVVRRTLAALAAAGIIETQTGRHGGSRLARAPESVTLADVYRAVEGDPAMLAHNPNPPNKRCAVSCTIRTALEPVFADVDDAVAHALGATTVADIVARTGPTGGAGRRAATR